jgi:hypothetical protein
MEFSLYAKDGAFPCEVTLDDANGRYMIRKSDTSGEVFPSPEALIQWVETHWDPQQFHQPNEFQQLMNQLRSYK